MTCWRLDDCGRGSGGSSGGHDNQSQVVFDGDFVPLTFLKGLYRFFV